MMRLTLADLAEVVGGVVCDPADGHRAVDSVTVDSRTVTANSLFVALPGEHSDGHDHISAAAAAGAGGYLCRADHVAVARGGVAVDDPGDALRGLGAWVRSSVDPTVVAITGSSGKTTTKDLAAAAVGAGRRVVANPGSYNNELGVPLTCCLLEPGTQVLIVELGARGLGHITQMAQIVRPDVGVVTNVGAAHLEMFGSVDTVAEAKAELVAALPPGGVALLNADDPRVAAMADRAGCRVVTFGTSQGADVRATDVRLDATARPVFRVRDVRVRLPLPGAHNVGNALAALAAAEACGVDLAAAALALADASVSPWRMELSTTAAGVVVVNDAYNANPASMAAALVTLAAMSVSGRRFAVLGQMAELGAGAEAAHRDVGRRAAELDLDGIVVVGERAAAVAAGARQAGLPADAVAVVADAGEAVNRVRGWLAAGDAVLVKASRSVGLERVAAALHATDTPIGATDMPIRAPRQAS
jgi:UDP-N-acetylmuramoyl-tripeptide--D-alanyl-D-alanine ligase